MAVSRRTVDHSMKHALLLVVLVAITLIPVRAQSPVTASCGGGRC